MTIEEVKSKYEHSLLALPNVTGVGIGSKKSFNREVGRIAIIVFVKAKVNLLFLTPQERIPSLIDGYETDVVETGSIFALQ